MKIFISSLISGFEEYRAAARDAVRALGHEPVMAEDFPSQPNSPQIACLSGLRQSALILLLLGERYGAPQSSGLSATHEEYREAKNMRPVIAFVQDSVPREPEQKEFVTEVQQWEGGLFRGGFSTPAQLKDGVTRAIHEWMLASAAGSINEGELLDSALLALPKESQNSFRSQQRLFISIAFGPRHNVLRPSEIESIDFIKNLKKAALFGINSIFDSEVGTQHMLKEGALVLNQGEGKDSFCLDPTGNMLFAICISSRGHMPIVIEEEIRKAIDSALAFASEIIDHIDPTQKITHLAPALTFENTQSLVWRTEAEQRAQPSSYSMGAFGQTERKPVHLSPAIRRRSAITLDRDPMVEDLLVLMRRMWV